MKRWLLIVLLLAWTLIYARWCAAQCGPGGCCPGGQCYPDTGDWRSSSPAFSASPSVAAREGGGPRRAWRYEAASGHYRSVVRVQTVDRDGARSFGSGVAVRWGNRTVVLTAGHVVRDARQVWVRGRGGYRVARVLKADAAWDVAVLSVVAVEELEPVEIAYRATGHPKPGERLESCGFGGDGRLAVNGGRFIGYRAPSSRGGTADWLVLSGCARGGDSGGPVFNSRHELVGVLWGTGGGQVVATQCGRLHVVLREALGDGGTGDWGLGIGTCPSCPTGGSPSAVSDAQTGLARRTGLLNRERGVLPACRPRAGGAAPAPQVIVHSDPAISRKLDVLIENTRPRPAAVGAEDEEEPPAPSTSPVVMLLVVGGAVVLGFVVYFGAAGRQA